MKDAQKKWDQYLFKSKPDDEVAAIIEKNRDINDLVNKRDEQLRKQDSIIKNMEEKEEAKRKVLLDKIDVLEADLAGKDGQI